MQLIILFLWIALGSAALPPFKKDHFGIPFGGGDEGFPIDDGGFSPHHHFGKHHHKGHRKHSHESFHTEDGSASASAAAAASSSSSGSDDGLGLGGASGAASASAAASGSGVGDGLLGGSSSSAAAAAAASGSSSGGGDESFGGGSSSSAAAASSASSGGSEITDIIGGAGSAASAAAASSSSSGGVNLDVGDTSLSIGHKHHFHDHDDEHYCKAGGGLLGGLIHFIDDIAGPILGGVKEKFAKKKGLLGLNFPGILGRILFGDHGHSEDYHHHHKHGIFSHILSPLCGEKGHHHYPSILGKLLGTCFEEGGLMAPAHISGFIKAFVTALSSSPLNPKNILCYLANIKRCIIRSIIKYKFTLAAFAIDLASAFFRALMRLSQKVC